MKKNIHFLLLLLAILLPATASAYDFEVDGIYYNVNGTEATVTSSPSSNQYSGNVTIPATVTYGGTTYSVTSIGDCAFSDCRSLTSIDIPNSVTSIGDVAFYCCRSLTCIDIPNSVTSIGDYAFNGCSGLTSVSIPNSVSTISNGEFDGCSGLTSIDIPSSVTIIGSWAFAGCIGLTDIIIPNSVGTIGGSAFYCCDLLTSVTIPNSVTFIGNEAFYGCWSLTCIEIPNSVTSIGESAFYWCESLTIIQVESGNMTYDSRNNCNAIIETATNTLIAGCMNTDIPNSVTSIGNHAFACCSGLTNITIPNSVAYIGESAFESCSGLTEIYSLAMTSPTVYNNTFTGCYGATLYVPYNALDNYKAADYWKEFTNIESITFEADGKHYLVMDENTVSVMANKDEGSLYSGDVVIPDSVTYEGMSFAVTGIEDNAFDGCYDLTSVVIGDNVETIGEQAFQGCTGLTNVTIGSGVTSIGSKAFNYCNALTTVKCMGTVPPVMASSDCFSTAAYNRATLLVPRNSEATYAAADYWYKFAHIDGWGSAGMGDVNGDGIMSIADVTVLIDALLNGDYEGIYFESADLNSNGRLDIGDVTSLIDNLLNN